MNPDPSSDRAVTGETEARPAYSSESPTPAPSVADRYADLLRQLSPQRRRGIVSALSIGYYEGWRPSRDEVADLVAIELGQLTLDEGIQRQRRRNVLYHSQPDPSPRSTTSGGGPPPNTHQYRIQPNPRPHPNPP